MITLVLYSVQYLLSDPTLDTLLWSFAMTPGGTARDCSLSKANLPWEGEGEGEGTNLFSYSWSILWSLVSCGASGYMIKIQYMNAGELNTLSHIHISLNWYHRTMLNARQPECLKSCDSVSLLHFTSYIFHQSSVITRYTTGTNGYQQVPTSTNRYQQIPTSTNKYQHYQPTLITLLVSYSGSSAPFVRIRIHY